MARTSTKDDAAVISQVNMNALQLGYDLEHRALYLFGEIDNHSAYRFIAGFKWLDRTAGPIHVILSSPGGNNDAGVAIFEAIRTANNPTIIEGTGMVASAAVPALLAGTIRFLNPDTRVMIHNSSYVLDGNVSTPDVAVIQRDAEVTNKWYHKLIAERTGSKIREVQKWCADEMTFKAGEAVAYGFADKVLEARPWPKTYEEGLKEIQGYIVTPRKPRKKGKKS
jgi:ATP-dependent Clp protease protease subunit